jgi:hypothetical protein
MRKGKVRPEGHGQIGHGRGWSRGWWIRNRTLLEGSVWRRLLGLDCGKRGDATLKVSSMVETIIVALISERSLERRHLGCRQSRSSSKGDEKGNW